MTHEIVSAEPPYVLIKWNPPLSPNGLIILYEVFYRKVGDTEVSTESDDRFVSLRSYLSLCAFTCRYCSLTVSLPDPRCQCRSVTIETEAD